MADSIDSNLKYIVLVDDEEAVRGVAGRTLTNAGYNVTQFRNSLDALDYCKDSNNSLDLLLTDVGLPDMDGRVLADKVTEERPGTPVVYMSGHADAAIIEGTDSRYFLQKPFDRNSLLDIVQEALAGPQSSE